MRYVIYTKQNVFHVRPRRKVSTINLTYKGLKEINMTANVSTQQVFHLEGIHIELHYQLIYS